MIKIEELARRLGDSVPPALREARHDLEENFRAVLRAFDAGMEKWSCHKLK